MPPQPTPPNLQNATVEELKIAMNCAPTQRTFIRLQVLENFYRGFDYALVEKMFSGSKRTFQRIISAWNKQGIDGLIERPKTGRPPLLSPPQIEVISDLLLHPEKAQQAHWTARKLHGFLRQELAIEVGYSTLTRALAENRWRLKYPRPIPAKGDETLKKAFRERLSALQRDTDVEIWFQDESGFEGDPRPRRRWMKVGAKGTVPRNGWHLRRNVSGMVCPRTGEVFFCTFSHSDTECFQAFLGEAQRWLELSKKRQILVLDNATWHKSKRIDWGRFEPLYLPPYSPDLNPIERLWQVIKQEWFTDHIATSYEGLNERLNQSLLWA
ncbi:MAG: IS630 family transposase, partial [Sumerlaeia bacterium]